MGFTGLQRRKNRIIIRICMEVQYHTRENKIIVTMGFGIVIMKKKTKKPKDKRMLTIK